MGGKDVEKNNHTIFYHNLESMQSQDLTDIHTHLKIFTLVNVHLSKGILNLSLVPVSQLVLRVDTHPIQVMTEGNYEQDSELFLLSSSHFQLLSPTIPPNPQVKSPLGPLPPQTPNLQFCFLFKSWPTRM